MEFRYFDIVKLFGLLDPIGYGGLFELIFGKPIQLTGTYWPLVILSATGLAFKNGLYIFMMRQFFRGVPDELEESAYIDGSGTLRTFLQIIIPLSDVSIGCGAGSNESDNKDKGAGGFSAKMSPTVLLGGREE
jgi:ABC-type maltose transport system permease subunit